MTWYGNHGKAVSRTETSNEIQKLILNQSAAAVKPRRVAPLKFYQRLYYGSRIQQAVNEEWKKEAAEREALIASGATVKKVQGAILGVMEKVTSQLWEQETEEFKQSVLDLRDQDMEAQLEKKRANETNPETPNDYQM